VRAPARALALACLLVAAPLHAVEEPDFETAAREVEIELARRSFERMLHYAIRLKTVSEPIRADGASLCGDRLAPVLGLIVTDRWELPWALHEPAADRFQVDGRTRVLWVMPGFASDRAGLRPRDVIVSVDGIQVEDAASFRVFKPEGPGPMRYLVERDGSYRTLEVENVPGCYSPADVIIDSRINAIADGNFMLFFTGFLRHFPDDDHLALVVGHELAHNILGHVGRDGGPELEAEADYMGAYLAARAGYDVRDAEAVFRELGLLFFYAAGPNARRSHPTSPSRVLALRQTVSEIEAKIAGEQPLEPDYWD
jgi:hypothetical protein